MFGCIYTVVPNLGPSVPICSYSGSDFDQELSGQCFIPSAAQPIRPQASFWYFSLGCGRSGSPQPRPQWASRWELADLGLYFYPRLPKQLIKTSQAHSLSHGPLLVKRHGCWESPSALVRLHRDRSLGGHHTVPTRRGQSASAQQQPLCPVVNKLLRVSLLKQRELLSDSSEVETSPYQVSPVLTPRWHQGWVPFCRI